ncbi:CBS domain-containing protein [Streptomyces virginiae]|uniref:CBS domain-containing protein n=1 Tax=Streptomyces virginiae TaxID=1961 RepID=UPI003675D0E2
MTGNPVTVEKLTSLAEAARVMRDASIGDVLVVDEGRLRGILTDRDIVVRAIAENRDPADTTVYAVCSPEPVTVGPGDDVDHAVDLMRRNALRRLPVETEDGELVGVVTLGDLGRRAGHLTPSARRRRGGAPVTPYVAGPGRRAGGPRRPDRCGMHRVPTGPQRRPRVTARLRSTLLGVGAMNSPRFAPAGLLVSYGGQRVAFDTGPGADPPQRWRPGCSPTSRPNFVRPSAGWRRRAM